MTSLPLPAQRRPDSPRASKTSARRSERAELGLRLSPARERELARRIQAGDAEARTEMIEANIGLAKYFALRYRGRQLNSLQIDDLIQEGMRGLVKAVDHYDPATWRTRFATCAGYWINRQIRLSLMQQDDMVRLPVHIHERGLAADRRMEVRGRNAILVSLAPAEDQLEEVIQREDRERLQRALKRLRPEQRKLLLWWATEYGRQGRKQVETKNERRNRAYKAKQLINHLRATLNQEGSADD